MAAPRNNLPYGYCRDGSGGIVADHIEQDIIANVRVLRDQGLSLAGVALRLNGMGCRTRRGTLFSRQRVAQIERRMRSRPDTEDAS